MFKSVGAIHVCSILLSPVGWGSGYNPLLSGIIPAAPSSRPLRCDEKDLHLSVQNPGFQEGESGPPKRIRFLTSSV